MQCKLKASLLILFDKYRLNFMTVKTTNIWFKELLSLTSHSYGDCRGSWAELKNNETCLIKKSEHIGNKRMHVCAAVGSGSDCTESHVTTYLALLYTKTLH